jgi:hypothetical protein
MYIGLHVKYPLFLSDFNETNFLGRLSKNIQIRDITKIRPVGAEMVYAGGRTDMTQVIVDSQIFANSLEKKILK